MPLIPGSLLENRYRVDALLGQGGMGAVYRAWDTRLEQWVALKENALATPEARAQFEREAKILARLHHSNLPKVIDHFVTHDGRQYLVMSYIDGMNLAELLASRGRQSPADVMSWLGQVCDALTYLHNQNPPIIHRDVKPQNIKITPDGQVFLVDFGLSKVGSAYQSTASGAHGVTPGFSPWEQYGQGHTDQRSDVYALSATLYAMLTGETPPDSVQRGLAGTALRSPRELNPALSPALERAVLHGLETQPPNRPPTAAALRQEVETSLATANTVVVNPGPRDLLATPAANHSSSERWPSQRTRGLPAWVLVAMAAMAVIVLAVGVQAVRGPNGIGLTTAPLIATATPINVLLFATIATESPMPTDTPGPKIAAQPTNTPELPTDTPTTTPTATATPTATSTPTTTPTASATTVTGKIVFAGNPGGFSHLYLVTGNGGNRREITYGAEHFWNPMLSQDGSRLAFTSKINGNTEVFVADGEGRSARAISNHPTEDDHPSWFPNNTEIAFASARDGPWEIYRMRADGSNVQRLTWNGGDNRFSVVSPDGRQIAYLSQSGEYPLIQLVVMNADGGSPRVLYAYRSHRQRDDFSRYLYRPDWSPDGTSLAMGADHDDDGVISILLVDVASGAAQPLIADGNNPAWSPDSRRLIYAIKGVHGVLYVANASGQRLFQLTDAGADAWSPDWSP